MSEFNGFPAEGIAFLRQLRENNNKEWWDANKETYVTQVQEPALALVASVGEKLKTINENIHYDLRTNGSGSLMRPYRDTRFSKDKTPYKTNVAAMWWEGTGQENRTQRLWLSTVAGRVRVDGGHVWVPETRLRGIPRGGRR